MDEREFRQRNAKALARLSHDFRTPLTSILGFSELLRDGAMGELNDDQRETLEDIQTSARQLLDQVNQVLDLSRAEHGQTTYQPEDIALASLLEDVRRGLRPQLAERGLRMDIELEVGTAATDRVQLTRLLQNLLSNAIRHAASRIVVRCSARLDTLWIQVWDDGAGLTADQAARAFDELYTLDRDRSSPRRGAGLGLALVRALVEHRGGRVGLDHTGPGCTAWLSLPGAIPTRPVSSPP